MKNKLIPKKKIKKCLEGEVLLKNAVERFFDSLKKIKYKSAPSYEASSLKEAITKAYRDGNKGENIWYDGNIYKAEFNDADERLYNQHEQNRLITNEQVVDAYIDNVLWIMENPNNKGYNKITGKYYSYKDNSLPKNIGPGIAYTSNMAKNMDFSKGYTKDELNTIVRPALLESMEEITRLMHEKYGENADTLSLGNRLIQLDIAHNVAPRGSRKANMPVTGWPALTEAMMTGDKVAIEKNTYSNSYRRQLMRNMLIWKNIINKNTVKNY